MYACCSQGLCFRSALDAHGGRRAQSARGSRRLRFAAVAPTLSACAAVATAIVNGPRSYATPQLRADSVKQFSCAPPLISVGLRKRWDLTRRGVDLSPWPAPQPPCAQSVRFSSRSASLRWAAFARHDHFIRDGTQSRTSQHLACLVLVAFVRS